MTYRLEGCEECMGMQLGEQWEAAHAACFGQLHLHQGCILRRLRTSHVQATVEQILVACMGLQTRGNGGCSFAMHDATHRAAALVRRCKRARNRPLLRLLHCEPANREDYTTLYRTEVMSAQQTHIHDQS